MRMMCQTITNKLIVQNNNNATVIAQHESTSAGLLFDQRVQHCIQLGLDAAAHSLQGSHPPLQRRQALCSGAHLGCHGRQRLQGSLHVREQLCNRWCWERGRLLCGWLGGSCYAHGELLVGVCGIGVHACAMWAVHACTNTATYRRAVGRGAPCVVVGREVLGRGPRQCRRRQRCVRRAKHVLTAGIAGRGVQCQWWRAARRRCAWCALVAHHGRCTGSSCLMRFLMGCDAPRTSGRCCR